MSDIAGFGLFADLHPNPDRPLSAATARAGLAALQDRSARITAQAALLSAAVRMQQTMFESVIAALATAGEPLPQALAVPCTTLEVYLTADDFDCAQVLIERLQVTDDNLSIDDCIAEIFMTGMTTLAHRLIPTP